MMNGCFSSRLGRIAALAALSLAAIFPAVAAQPPKTSLVFYADKQVSDTLWPGLFDAIQQDLARNDYAVPDLSPHLMLGSNVRPGEAFGSVIGVKLVGRCDVVQQAYRPLQPGPLGWVLRVRGVIQPYVYVDCTRLAQDLNSTTLGMSAAQRTRAMDQAIAHVLVHEWIHIASQNSGHTEHGISEAQLTTSTLIAGPDPVRSTSDSDSSPALAAPGSFADEK